MDEGSIAGSASDFLLVSNYAQAISEEFKMIAEDLAKGTNFDLIKCFAMSARDFVETSLTKVKNLAVGAGEELKDSIKEIINTSTEALRENLVSALKKAANTLLKFVAKIFESIFHLCSLGP